MKHYHNLSKKELSIYHENINNITYSEKLDGSSVGFGRDEDGFFITRQQKNGQKYYNPIDDIWFNDFKKTFNALKNIPTSNIHYAEMLFGEKPNTVIYENINQIILFDLDIPDTEVEIEVDHYNISDDLKVSKSSAIEKVYIKSLQHKPYDGTLKYHYAKSTVEGFVFDVNGLFKYKINDSNFLPINEFNWMERNKLRKYSFDKNKLGLLNRYKIEGNKPYYLNLLKQYYDEYIENRKNYKLIIDEKEYVYDDYIHKKTLFYYKDCFDYFEEN